MIFLILIFILYAIIWSLPLYAAINLVLWLFGVTFRITIGQTIGIIILITIIQSYFEKKEYK